MKIGELKFEQQVIQKETEEVSMVPFEIEQPAKGRSGGIFKKGYEKLKK